MGITVGLLGLLRHVFLAQGVPEKLRTILSQFKKNTVGVHLQAGLHGIGPCSGGLRHVVRFKDMNGLAQMERSQVTHVPLVFDTFKRALSPHRTCVAPVLSVTRRRLVQQHVAGVC